MPNPLIMHINYCEPDLAILEACRKASAWGFEGIEFRRRNRWESQDAAGYLDDVCRGFEKYGLKHAIIGNPAIDLVQPGKTARQAELDEAIAFYEAAFARLPVVAINAMLGLLRDAGAPLLAWERHGSACARPEHWDWAVEGARQIAACADAKGIAVGLETHMNYLHDNVEGSLKLVELAGSPNLGLTLDLGNLLLMPDPPTAAEVLEKCLDRTVLLHLKNINVAFDGARTCARLKDGQIDNRAVLRTALRAGYVGPVVIEAPADGDRQAWAPEDCAYIRTILDDLISGD